MKSSEILREAARLVERQEWHCGCDAIAVAAGKPQMMIPPDKPMRSFELLRPSRRADGDTWWGRLEIGTYRTEANRNSRIVGLCLAAAIAESEGD